MEPFICWIFYLSYCNVYLADENLLSIKILTQKIDTTTPEGRLFFRINASFDQFLREIIVENTKTGLKTARNQGRIGGRPKALSEDKLKAAQSMLKDKDNYPFISDIIKTLQIGRTTFYKFFPPNKISELI